MKAEQNTTPFWDNQKILGLMDHPAINHLLSIPMAIPWATAGYLLRKFYPKEIIPNTQVSYAISEKGWKGKIKNIHSHIIERVEHNHEQSAKLLVTKGYFLSAPNVLIVAKENYNSQTHYLFALIPFQNLKPKKKSEVETIFHTKEKDIFHYECDTIVYVPEKNIVPIPIPKFRKMTLNLMKREAFCFLSFIGAEYLSLAQTHTQADHSLKNTILESREKIKEMFLQDKYSLLSLKETGKILSRIQKSDITKELFEIPIFQKMASLYAASQ